MTKIYLSEEIVDMCFKFAEDRVEGSKRLYSMRGSSKIQKIKSDIFVGCLGEWAAWQYLIENFIDVCEPDMNLYDNRTKSYSADLQGSGINIHVKSQSTESADNYGCSWLMQRNDPIVKEGKEFKDDYVFMCIVDLNDFSVDILGMVEVENIVWGECKVPMFRTNKVALYYEDNLKKVFRCK